MDEYYHTDKFAFTVCLPESKVELLQDLHLGRTEILFNMQGPSIW